MPLVDLDDEFLNLLFSITNSKKPQNVELVDLKKQLLNVVEAIKEINKN